MLWNNALETGVASIDAQHKELFRQVEELLNAGMNQRSREKIKETMDFLETYIVKHFADEEALQKSSKYPKAITHKALHDNYVLNFTALKRKYEAEGETLNIVMMVNKSVVDWLVGHINGHDKEFAVYYKNQK